MIEVNHALFGEVGSSHALRAHSGADSAVLELVQTATDLPPHGADTTWMPCVSGYPADEEGVYVVQRMAPDSSASRFGMVKTHVAFIPSESLDLVDIGAVFAALDPDLSPLGLEPIRFEPGRGTVDADPVGTRNVVASLADSGQALWSGQERFEELIASLWERLAPEDLRRLTFGLLFHPSAVPYRLAEVPLEVWSVPFEVAHRWADDLLISGDPPTPESELASAFLGEPDGETLNALRERLGIEQPTLVGWRTLARLQPYVQELGALPAEGLRAAAQLLASVCPEPAEATDLKRKLLAELRAQTRQGGLVEVRGLRAIDWSAFEDGSRERDETIEDWAKEQMQYPRQAAGKALADAIAASRNWPDDATRSSLLTAIEGLARARPREVSKVVLRYVSEEQVSTPFHWLLGAVREFDVDGVVRDEGRDVPLLLPGELRPLAVKEGWAHIHAASATGVDPVELWREHLDLPNQPNSARDLLGTVVGSEATVLAARQIGDDRLMEFAGQLCTRDPRLLKDFDGGDVSWLMLLESAVAAGMPIWALDWDRQATTWQVLDAVVAHKLEVPATLTAISDSGLCDLSAYPLRGAIWATLREPYGSAFLAVTAEAVSRDLAVHVPVEPEIEEALLDPVALSQLADSDVAAALNVIEYLKASEDQVIRVVDAGGFSVAHSKRLGQLIVEHRWRRVSQHLVSRASLRADLVPAAYAGLQNLGFLDRLVARAKLPPRERGLDSDTNDASKDELWTAVDELLTELYPQGPQTSAMWERGGGDEADLRDDGSGRERWRHALRQARRGRVGAPPLSSLLAVACEDFPKNEAATLLRAEVDRLEQS